jgi:ribonucleoside-diphosphate reductase alpha chain
LQTVIKRDGRRVPWDGERIRHAIEMAFRAEVGFPYPDPLPSDVDARVTAVADAAIARLEGRGELHIEQIQDEVERCLMAAGEFAVARRYILYREARAARREGERLRVLTDDGRPVLLERSVLKHDIADACSGLVDRALAEAIYQDTIANLYPGITLRDLEQAKVLAARAHIEQDPACAFVAGRLMLDTIYSEAVGLPLRYRDLERTYGQHFAASIRRGVETGHLDPRLLDFDLERLGAAIRPERDLLFRYMGLQVLYDRYLIHHEGRRLELPQGFWMRVAMGLALAEPEAERTHWAITFYDVLSQFLFCSSSPTLFNSGTRYPQLSSCFLTTVPDDLHRIFMAIHDNAMLSKWSGGLGNDWTPVRALGSLIRGTNGRSQGVIPFLKVANDTAVAVNQGGKRKGAVCAYLETWHLDIEEFLDLRKNTGDERRRTHDMNTANWVPDLFMKRVAADAEWTLFSPDEVPDLHELYGRAFERRYEEYECLADAGGLRNFRRVRALDLWRRILSMLFETGHPWITFKDPCNVRSPQDHVGVVHSSNLCTEITLNTNEEEIAVCNLGSVNLAAHVGAGGLDLQRLRQTISVGMRMLDNVIDINLYPVEQARRANLRHRPVGLGIMGFQDALYRLGLSYASEEAVDFADRSMEAVSYFAILASAELAAERGPYPSYHGSKWDRGLLPIDTLALLAEERGGHLDVDRSSHLDWTPVREAVRRHGMRNSNCMAIAPTATIANITGVSQSIEPTYRNLYVKSNLSGEFTVINEYLVADLKAAGLWDQRMIDDLKYYDGSLMEIERIPDELKQRYLTAFEVDPSWLIECAARRQKWIDQSQSLNLYLAEPSGRRLQEMYMLAWERGLKTTYYLRSLSATQVEKSTLDVNARGIQPRWMKARSASAAIHIERGPQQVELALAASPSHAVPEETPSANGVGVRPAGRGADAPLALAEGAEATRRGQGEACSLDDPGCEACQ